MSEKERFVVDYEVGVLDTKTNKIICDTVSADEVVDLLNELNDESEQLKEQLKLIRKDLTHIMLLLLNDEIVKQLSDYDMKVFERLSKA